MAEQPLEKDVVTRIVRALLGASWLGASLFAAIGLTAGFFSEDGIEPW